MKVLVVEYTIVEIKEKNIKVLMPNRILIGQEENNTITSKNEKIEHISKTNYEHGKNCYVTSISYEEIEKQLKPGVEYNEEELINSLVETTNEEVIYIENGEIKEAAKEEFQKNFNLLLDYNNRKISEIKEEMTINEVVETVKSKIMFQDNAIKAILSTIIKNKYSENSKNIVLIGPKGIGKTKIVDLIAKTLNSPYAKVNNYSGDELTNSYITILLSQNNVESLGPAIIFIDEIDKGIEKLNKIDGDIIVEMISKILKKKSKFPLPISDERTVLFDPDQINFIIALNLEKNIESPKTINIGGDNNKIRQETIAKLREMLVDANCEIIDMNNLTENNLKEILIKSEISPINEYNKLLNIQGLKIKVSKKAYELIAHEAYTLNKGAKGLSIITDYILKDEVINAQFNGEKDIFLTEKKVLKKIKDTDYKKRLY